MQTGSDLRKEDVSDSIDSKIARLQEIFHVVIDLLEQYAKGEDIGFCYYDMTQKDKVYLACRIAKTASDKQIAELASIPLETVQTYTRELAYCDGVIRKSRTNDRRIITVNVSLGNPLVDPTLDKERKSETQVLIYKGSVAGSYTKIHEGFYPANELFPTVDKTTKSTVRVKTLPPGSISISN